MAAYVAKQCGIDRAGIIAFALLDPSLDPTNVELSDPAWWLEHAEGSPPDLYVIKPARGDYEGGTPTEEEGFGRESSIVTGADHLSNVEAQGMKENRDFWEGANRRKWKFVFVTNGDLLYYINLPVTVFSTPSNPRDPKASAFWKITAKWQDYSNPVIVDMPEDIFEIE